MEKFQRLTDEPALSEATLLIKVEDLIGLTFGDGDTNVINFKMLQHILHILARKMRILEQDVELRFSEEDDILQDLKATYGEPLMGFEDEKAKGKGKGAKGKDAKDKKKGKKVDEGPKEKRVSRGSMTTSDSRSQIGSIEVVTASQFNILNRMVQHLLKRTGGVPLPSMPSNEDLLAELAKGTVSLPEAMEAMQVNARVRAVEHALTMMASLLTQLAASGLLPPAVQAIINQMQSDLQQLALTTGIELEPPTTSKSMLGGGASASKTSIPPEKRNVTTPEMNEALEILKDELNKNLEELTAKSESAAEKAGVLVKSVAEKMEVVLEIDKRLADISSLTTDYDIQMQGFDSGLGLQLQAFREQMISLRTELGNGLQQLEAATANSESNALIELRSSYESLVQDLEQTSANHGALLILQKQLSDELKRLVESVELLREEKADRDEVADGLRDKANISRLKGLLRQPQFDESYKELQYRLNLSYEKFHRQEDVWMTALDDLKDIVMTKASYDELVNLKEFAVKTLNEFFEYLRRLEILLGEPKTAMLTHKLSRTGYCGPCQVGALMEPTDVRSSAPPKLPPLRKEGGGEPFKTICTVREDAEAAGKHACKRWVGGSHTLISEHTTREHATPALGTDIPTRQYIGLGNDGRVIFYLQGRRQSACDHAHCNMVRNVRPKFYHMEEDLEPCLECNKITPSETEEDLPPPEEGGGDIA